MEREVEGVEGREEEWKKEHAPKENKNKKSAPRPYSSNK